MNILIADDELLARTVLKHMLQDLNMDLNIVGEAADGRDLIGKMKQQPVDLAFIDIKMPDINGLDSIRILKNSYPNTNWVILSGYSKFEYAKEAMELGAVRYLLKPITLHELRKTITEISDVREKSHASMNIDFENVILAYFYKLISAEQLKETFVYSSSHFTGGIVYIDSFLDENLLSPLRLEITNKIHKIIEKYLRSGIYIAYFILPISNPVIICSWDPDKISFGEKTASNCFSEIWDLMHECRSDNFYPTLIKTGTCRCFKELCEKISKIQNSASLRVTLHNSGSLKLNELLEISSCISELDLKIVNLIIKLSETFKNKSYLSYAESLDKLKKIMSDEKINSREFVSSYCSFISYTLGIDLKKSQTVDDIINKLKKNQQKLLGYGIEPADIVSQAITFIHESYMGNSCRQLTNGSHLFCLSNYFVIFHHFI